ncbi:hypothetical protein Tco_0380191, partial [Tanacetum coccineum]
VDTELYTNDIQRTKTYEDFKNELNDELDEPWSEDGVPYEIYDDTKLFVSRMGKLNGPPAVRMKTDSVMVEN